MAKVKHKAIITCAVTGGAHTPTMSPHLPITPEQIAAQAIEAVEAGASVVHFHARLPDGRPTQDPEVYRPAVEEVRAKTDAIINITTSGHDGTPLENRMAAALALRPEMASLNMGSMSPYGRDAIVDRFPSWQHEWEPKAFQSARTKTYTNTEAIIETIIRTLSEVGVRFECECYDISHLYNAAYFVDKGLLKPPFSVQTVFGFSGGIAGDAEHIIHMHNTARRLFGDDLRWSVLAPGKLQMRTCTIAAAMGANVRVGMEDSLTVKRGQLAKSNAEQVRHIREILEMLSIDIATPAEAREALGLAPRA